MNGSRELIATIQYDRMIRNQSTNHHQSSTPQFGFENKILSMVTSVMQERYT
jgi:hypothetical protein